MSFAAAISNATDQAFGATSRPGIDLLIAGIPVRLQASDQQLLSAFTTALTHHKRPIAKPQAVIRIWSAAATGIQRPTMPEALQQRVIARCKNLGEEQRYLLDFDPTGGMVTVIDTATAQVNVCLSSLKHLPHWERAAPLRSAMSWILQQQDIHLLHAAAVADDGGAALLLGAGGAGKSTASLRCHQAGMQFLGDDLCAFQAGSRPRVFNVYGTAKTVWNDLAHFQDFQSLLISKPGALKAVYALNQATTTRISTTSELRVLLLLDHRRPVGSVKRANRAKAVGIAASTTASFLPGSGRPMLSALADLARHLPVLSISLGEEPQQVRDLVQRAIRGPEQLLEDCGGT